MDHTMLITIDFVNDLTATEGKFSNSLAFLEKHQTIKHMNDMITWARSCEILIAHVRVGFSNNYLECPPHSEFFQKVRAANALHIGTWGTEFHPALHVQKNDICITKRRISAFYNTDLDVFLRAHRIKKIIIGGISTNMAVESTAREAHDRDYEVCIIQDACATSDITIHEHSLMNLKRIAEVMTAAEWIKKNSC